MFIPEMNTCDKCQWWNEAESYNWGHHKCKNPKLDDYKSGDGAQPEALDDTGIHFATGPKFGCIHWQLKRWQPTPEEVARMAEGAE